MHAINGVVGAGLLRRVRAVVAAGLLGLAGLWPAMALAQTSTYCPTPLTATVAWGGSVSVNVSNCDGAFDGGMSGPFAPLAVHGTVTIGPNSGGVQFVTYAHGGSTPAGGGSDTIWLEDEDNGTVRINITISAPISPITVSPASLPTLTAGSPFSQTLTSAGGTAPYTYALQSGTLPVGLSLTSGGVISGTPTQRGGYSFSVRSTDNIGQFADKGYTGTVQNPTLTLAAPSGTAIQTVAFSQTLTTTGGVAPHTYLLETGTLPAGISVSSGGVVSGTTAAAPGNYPVTLRVTDASTGPGQYFELENYTLTVSPPPSVSIAVAPASVSEDGATNLVYTVTRSLNLSSPTVVNITTSGTATAGTDYTGNVSTVTIPAGATTASITIDPTVDGTVEADETVILTVAAGTGYTVGTPSSATGTLLNDDVPSATLTVSPAAVAEDGAANLIYTVTLNQPSSSAVSINYTVGGTATNGTDYATITSPLVIPAGNTTGTITVNPTADATIEADETVVLTLAAGAGYTVGVPNSATGTVLNDDLPNLTINDVTASEGNAGTTNFTFTVSLSAPAGPGGVTFDIATANGTATAGVDYVGQSLTGQTIPAGSSTYTFTVQVNGDTQNESTETFFVNVTNVVNAVVVDGQGLGTVVNDDPLPSLSINDVTVVEGNAGVVNANFTVSLSAPSGQTVSVNYATADGTATAPGDYTSLSGALIFAPGQTALAISVFVNGDVVPEANETFLVNLSGATNATIADNQGVGTISNDDVPVTVSPSSVPGGAVAVAYSQTLTASGGVAPYTFAVTAGSLPAGLSLSAGGVLSGTPTAGGTFNFTVTATDSSAFPGPFVGSQAYALTVAPATVVLPATTLAGATLGTGYSAGIAASGGTAPYTYAVTAGALPSGLALNPSTGAITGTPTALGTFNFDITATDASTGTGPYTATQGYAIVVVDAPPVASSSSLTVAYGSGATSVPLNLSGGAATSVAVVTPATHGTAVASGTSITYTPDPGYAGPDSFTYSATNSGGTSAPATVSVTVSDPVVTITTGGPLNGAVASPYTQTFTFNGGAAPWSGFQVTNLPAGVSITGSSTTSVTVSGTPTQAGSFNLNVSATDSSTGNGPYSVGQVFVLTVAAPTLTLAPAAGTLTAPYAVPYSQAFTAAGGVGPYTYATVGALPPGLSLGGGVLSGTPTVPGSYAVTVTATDTGSSGTGAPFSVSQNYTIDVPAPVIVVAPASLPGTTAGLAYSQTLTATGGVAPYTFAVTAGALPTGVSLSAAGALSGTATASGTFNFTVTATDNFGQTASQAYSVVVAVPVLTLTPATLPGGVAGTAYSQTLTIAGGIAPYAAVLSGALPTGLTFDPVTRTFSGTPTQSGTFSLSVTVTDSTGGTAATVTNAYVLTITAPTLTLTPASLPATTAGAAYNTTFVAGGGIAPYAYAVSAGALPAGLALNAATGALAGIPTVAGSFAFSVTATDSTTGTAGTVTNAYTLAVAAPTIAVNPAVLPGGIDGVPYTHVLSAVGGTAPYTFAVTAGALPTGVTLATDGRLSGAPVAGSFGFTVTATDALGFTGTRAYMVVVTQRPDPSRDPEVRGLLEAQATATRRFASTQMNNFQQRLENLHDNREGAQLSSRLGFATSQKCTDYLGREPGECGDRVAALGPVAAAGSAGAAAADGDGSARAASAAPFATWIGGVIRSGSQDGRGGGARADFETDGISVGVDRRFSPAFALGAGIGYGRDKSDVGNHGSRVEGDAQSLVLYASYHPGDRYFLDALTGYQRLSYDLRRHLTVTDAFVYGSRDGSQWFGSLSAGAQFQHGTWQLTPYARVDVSQATLDAYVEQGDPVYGLAYGEQDVDATTGNLGMRFESRHAKDWGVFAPQARLEYQHDFSGDSSATMQYADLPTGPLYRADLAGFDRSRMMVGLGAMFYLARDFTFRAEYRGLFGNDGDRDNGLMLNFEKSY
ncbi:putative Ig domain-containing protein [Aerolutibacter daejeonensis]|uniref:putative Ig domain-containing protein n=1 Tax=Aerolutibacter daejeonensis TaxID=346181 RepID=UPI00068A6CB4|nr:putative Ig domain-containing protein [Lysobacter daejeonensis]